MPKLCLCIAISQENHSDHKGFKSWDQAKTQNVSSVSIILFDFVSGIVALSNCPKGPSRKKSKSSSQFRDGPCNSCKHANNNNNNKTNGVAAWYTIPWNAHISEEWIPALLINLSSFLPLSKCALLSEVSLHLHKAVQHCIRAKHGLHQP